MGCCDHDVLSDDYRCWKTDDSSGFLSAWGAGAKYFPISFRKWESLSWKCATLRERSGKMYAASAIDKLRWQTKMTMTLVKCACPTCTCEVSGSAAVVKNHQSFCSDACASGHPNNEPCHDAAGACGCSCGSWSYHYWKVTSPSNRLIRESSPSPLAIAGAFYSSVGSALLQKSLPRTTGRVMGLLNVYPLWRYG